MGAYVDAVQWGSDFPEDFKKAGFRHTDYITGYGRVNRANYVYAILESNGDLAWSSTSEPTIGLYNRDQEELLPYADGAEEEEPEPPLPAAPEITGFEFVENGTKLRLTFRVCTTNGIALTGDKKSDRLEWDVETKTALDDPTEYWRGESALGTVAFDQPITAAADGTWTEDLTATVNVNSLDGARFYRITATPVAK